eukprot:symbB.v1.2.015274.t1/scaffold1136.1/size135929/2
MACQPASQCCCGCSLEFGSYCILGINLLRSLLFIFIACDAVMHTEAEMKLHIEGSLADKAHACTIARTACFKQIKTLAGLSGWAQHHRGYLYSFRDLWGVQPNVSSSAVSMVRSNPPF